MLGLGIPSFGELFIIGVPLLLWLALTLIALIDILQHDFKGYDKIIWILLIIFLNPIGLLLYYIIGRKQRLSKV
jgi:hypothetical protein